MKTTPSLLKTFPSEVRFKYAWRKYQEEFLNAFEKHASNQHLHVIAPPGSGKTILGLEIARRLNHPTLILTPTITIRNQWVQRFHDFFWPQTTPIEWVTTNIRHPSFITVATYQALHSLFKENEDLSQFYQPWQHIQTLIVDEAHHLKNEWWKSLMALKEALDPVLVGLTATPPFDVSKNELSRYLTLCGPVDMEISIPELVREENICPHQDYVYFSTPDRHEIEHILEFRQQGNQFIEHLRQNRNFITALQNHPFLTEPENHLEDIYEYTEYFSSQLIFLHAVGESVDEKYLRLIGVSGIAFPDLEYEWVETLFNYILYQDRERYAQHEPLVSALEKELKRIGVIEAKKISFRNNEQVTKLLSTSLHKIESIPTIVSHEYQALGSDLRLVVLTDYIRKEYLPTTNNPHPQIKKAGVIPIWEIVCRHFRNHGPRIGVLSGTIVIIPVTALTALQALAHARHLPLHWCSIPHRPDFLEVSVPSMHKHHLTHWITYLFEQGEIQVLIGTKSLLGEGWDAPCINALILASFVGSYVLSNQMRGRAIRTVRDNPDKTANIWHLASLDPSSTDGGSDVATLKRRFSTFVGLSFGEELFIENNLDRLGLPTLLHPNDLPRLNQTMFEHADDRKRLKREWATAITRGHSLKEALKMPYPGERSYQKIRKLYFKDMVTYLFVELGIGTANFLVEFLLNHWDDLLFEEYQEFFVYLSIGLAIYFLPRLIKASCLYLQYGRLNQQIERIGYAILDTLIELQFITPRKKPFIQTELHLDGTVICYLDSASRYESAIFIKSLEEILDATRNPRYLLQRQRKWLWFPVSSHYHPVPELFGSKKKYAKRFQLNWIKYVGKCKLIFTRNSEGRQALLSARLNNLAAAFQDSTQKVSEWR